MAAHGSLGFAAVDVVYVFVLAVPAMALTGLFVPLLWHLGLMDAPGWYAFPNPLGIALVYAICIALTLGVSYALPRSGRR